MVVLKMNTSEMKSVERISQEHSQFESYQLFLCFCWLVTSTASSKQCTSEKAEFRHHQRAGLLMFESECKWEAARTLAEGGMVTRQLSYTHAERRKVGGKAGRRRGEKA